MRVLIGQLASAAQRTFDVLLWVVVLVVGLLMMLGALAWLKRRFDNSQESVGVPPFTLHDLTVMRDSGKMSEEEYQRARQRLIAMTRVVLTASGGAASSDTESADEKKPPEEGGGA